MVVVLVVRQETIAKQCEPVVTKKRQRGHTHVLQRLKRHPRGSSVGGVLTATIGNVYKRRRRLEPSFDGLCRHECARV